MHEVTWYKESKGHRFGLDYPLKQSSRSPTLLQHEDNAWFPPPCYWSPSLPSWTRLEQRRVRFPFIFHCIGCQTADLEFASSFPVVKWWSMAINGPCSCMQIKNSTPKNLGMGSSEASFLSGLVWINLHLYYSLHCLQAYKHIFTSPSSVEKEVKATRSGNTHIHGMTQVTPASLAYVATQVCMASKFYTLRLNIWPAMLFIVIIISVLQVWHLDRFRKILREHLGLFQWSQWERRDCWFAELVELVSIVPFRPLNLLTCLYYSQVFPSYITHEHSGIMKQSTLAKLKEKRARLKQIHNQGAS
jgi:hypothetical protein